MLLTIRLIDNSLLLIWLSHFPGVGMLKQGQNNIISTVLLTCLVALTACSEQERSELPQGQTHLGYQSKFTKVNSLNLHYVEAGSGEVMVFLHGFPFFAESWHSMLQPLSKQYRVIAPDHRGYGLSDKPSEIEDYKIDRLIEDTRTFIVQQSDNKPVILVGHDWGGVLAWGIAQQYPKLVKKVIVINAPPFNAFLDSLVKHQSQRDASVYIGKLKSWLANVYLMIKGPDVFWRGFEKLAEQGHIGEEFKQAFYHNWQQPDAINSALNWYKANIPEFDNINENNYWPSNRAKVEVPSLLIWSSQDKAFTQDTFNEITNHVSNLNVKVIGTSTHAPFLDNAPLIVDHIKTFIN